MGLFKIWEQLHHMLNVSEIVIRFNVYVSIH